MIIDIHAHIWKGMYEENKRVILKACSLYPIDKAYVSGVGEIYPDEKEIGELNSEVYRFMKEQPGLIGGFCHINPLHGTCMDELRKGIEEYGMSGMKLWCAVFCNDLKVFPLVERCIEYKIPILVHAFHKSKGQLQTETTGSHVADLAHKYPEARIIMAHLGGNCYHGVKAVRDNKNVSVDISGTLFRRDEIDYVKRQIGAERILFGTDIPTAPFITNYGQIEEADLTEAERQWIYSKNAMKLLGRAEG